MKERKNIYKLPAGDTTLEWYNKAVIEMKKRPSTDPTSWNYQAAIHGFRSDLFFWQEAAPFPGQAEQTKFWNQCQHGSWFFLPWHRMYLAYFEQIVAQTIAIQPIQMHVSCLLHLPVLLIQPMDYG
jgi:tyrosinase